MPQAVFLDKDGTLIEDVPYNVDPDRIQFTAGAIEALQQLHRAGYELIIISNQAGVAHGYFPETALRAVELHLRERLAAAGIPLSGFYYCPHHPAGKLADYTLDCHCRKPQPGLIRRAAADFAIDLDRSWMIGDILNDIEAGTRSGCRTVLIDNGNETEWQLSPARIPTYTCASLPQAAQFILANALRVEPLSVL